MQRNVRFVLIRREQSAIWTTEQSLTNENGNDNDNNSDNNEEEEEGEMEREFLALANREQLNIMTNSYFIYILSY